MRRSILILFITIILAALGLANSATVRADGFPIADDDWPIDGGRFFSQTTPAGLGYSVVDDDEAKFWTGFHELGGLQNVGYPISRRFYHRGFLTQAFQKLVLQWRPEVDEVWPVNVFDDLSYAGYDDVLYNFRQTPYHIGQVEPPGTPWDEIVTGRLAYLDANPAIRARYFSLDDPLTAFGVPTSKVEDMGNHYAIRTQRAVFQQWKEEVDWAAAGQVTVANGGDIAKELGLFPAAALEPESALAGGTETCHPLNNVSWTTPDGWDIYGSTVQNYAQPLPGSGFTYTSETVRVDVILRQVGATTLEEVVADVRQEAEEGVPPYTLTESQTITVAGLRGYWFDGVAKGEPTNAGRFLVLDAGNGLMVLPVIWTPFSNYIGQARAMLETLAVGPCSQ